MSPKPKIKKVALWIQVRTFKMAYKWLEYEATIFNVRAQTEDSRIIM